MILLPLIIVGCGDKEPENEQPVVAIQQFDGLDTFLQGNAIQIQANVSDTETDSEDLTIDWMLDGTEVCNDSVSNSSGLVTCELTPEIGSHVVIIEVYDQAGDVSGDSIEFDVIDGAAPAVEISNILSERI